MFVPISAKIVKDLVSKRILKPNSSVIDMGNQTYSVSQGVMKSIISDLTKDAGLVSEYNISIDALEKLSNQNPANQPKDLRAPLVSDFYNAIGFNSYEAIDINSDFGSMIMDLNKDLKEEYSFAKTYDLVTNIGVSEHLFNQAVFFKNAHELTKVGGVMVHILPTLGYANHGFFKYEPRIFQDLALANDYELLALAISERDELTCNLMVKSEVPMYFHEYIQTILKNGKGYALIVAVLRKKHDKPFVTPIQGKYIPDLEGNTMKTLYGEQHQYLEPTPTKGYFLINEKPTFRIKLKLKIVKFLWSLIGFLLKKI